MCALGDPKFWEIALIAEKNFLLLLQLCCVQNIIYLPYILQTVYLNYNSTERKKWATDNSEEMEKLKKQLKSEQLLKQQAVNKLAEILARKENMPANRKGKPVSSDLRKKEKECRKLQQELTIVSY